MTCTRMIALSSLTLALGLPIAQAQDDAPAEAQEAPPAGEPQALTPLAVGNTWVYENQADGIRTTERIEGMVLFDDQPWYLLRATERVIEPGDDEEPMVSEIWLANIDGAEADGFAEIDEETETLQITGITRYFRTRMAVGDKYKPDPDDPGLSIEVVAVDQEIKNKAGTFKCTAYKETHTDEPGYSFTTYLAPGVGIVRYSIEEDGQASTTDLIKYTLVDKP